MSADITFDGGGEHVGSGLAGGNTVANVAAANVEQVSGEDAGLECMQLLREVLPKDVIARTPDHPEVDFLQ